jgi:ubiquinone/menaquinone biosynthesis C-methylase UbiE
LKILGNPNMIRRIQAPVIMRMLNPKGDSRILDAGCGGGFFSYEIAKICRCIGIDWNISENLSYAMSRLLSVAYIKADVQKMPFKDGTFDKILLSSVLQMVEDDKVLLMRVLLSNPSLHQPLSLNIRIASLTEINVV